ncbi:MAG: radical SAM protein [Bifidobacteriaceae bacterium]|jgi:anaerobic ribonucleoside-triphosphate reductase activating protein|nr:radical SAM protein [Bifidobacteriaceae bacterium]
MIEVARTLSPVESLGPGRRVALWLQGCSLAQAGAACPGCISRDLWDSGPGELFDVSDLADLLVTVIGQGELTGLTVTGGEPLDQYAEVIGVVGEVRSRCGGELGGESGTSKLDTLLFTRYRRRVIERRFPLALTVFDAIIAGEYRRDLPSVVPLVASANQELIAGPEIADRYGRLGGQPRLQAFVSGGDVLMAGVPLPGQMEAVEEGFAERGVSFGSVSWMSESR